MRIPKTAIYYARSEHALRNGSVLRHDRPSDNAVACYMNGDYMGSVPANEATENPDLVAYTRDQARELLPLCCRP